MRVQISHATIHQNQSLLNAYRFGEVPWLAEGIAVSYGQQKAYYTRDEFLKRVWRERDLALFLDPARRGFNEFLMARDRAAYQRYLLTVMQDPRKWREMFAPEFGMTFDEAIVQFEAGIAQ